MPPTCCGKFKLPSNPDSGIAACQNEKWQDFCDLCPACGSDQRCKDELYDIYVSAHGNCVNEAGPSHAPTRPGDMALLRRMVRHAGKQLRNGSDCGCRTE